MTLGVRIEERRREVGISQAELARRVGVRQSTMNSLINGSSRTSRSLLRIARELGTTPAYLTGEVDDPDEGAPEAAELTFDERELLESFRSFDRDQQRALLTVAKGMAGPPAGATINAPTRAFHPQPAVAEQDLGDPPPLPPEHALAAMFEAILSTMPELDEEAMALALARHLPRALAQAADVDPDPAIARTPPIAAGAEAPPARRARRT